MQVRFEADVDTGVLDDKRVAVLGYGSQGHAHALNLRDSGCAVVIGQRTPSPRAQAAAEAGFEVLSVTEAVGEADVVMNLLPDEAQARVFEDQIRPALKPGTALGFAHGLAIHFGKITPPADAPVFLVAPKGPGPAVRSAFERGGGLPALVAVAQDPRGDADAIACAYAAALGCGRAGIMTTTFAAETECDLFGEQAVLCGGVIELMKAAYDVLIDAGFPPEMAYYECIVELKLIVDLIDQRGIAGMRSAISNTAKFGGLTRGPRIIDDRTRAALRQIYAEIRSGTFATEWLADFEAGLPKLSALMQEERLHGNESARELLKRLR